MLLEEAQTFQSRFTESSGRLLEGVSRQQYHASRSHPLAVGQAGHAVRALHPGKRRLYKLSGLTLSKPLARQGATRPPLSQSRPGLMHPSGISRPDSRGKAHGASSQTRPTAQLPVLPSPPARCSKRPRPYVEHGSEPKGASSSIGKAPRHDPPRLDPEDWPALRGAAMARPDAGTSERPVKAEQAERPDVRAVPTETSSCQWAAPYRKATW
jgi:hypothetical protein